MTEPQADGPKFRDNYLDVLTAAVARAIPDGPAPHKLDRLSHPDRHSPFLTLALRAPHGLRTHVVKVLVVLRSEGPYERWYQVFEEERQRLEREFAERRGFPQTLDSLALPLLNPEAPITAGELPPLRHVDLMERTGKLGTGDTAFPFFTRPYIPWPRLQETGYQPARMRQIFERYCREKKIQAPMAAPGQAPTREWKHFLVSALVSGGEADHEDVILASEWRLRRELDD